MLHQLLLTEDVVELVMRLLLAGEIDRIVACQFVTPWVEGELPSTKLAESGAQTIHGLDIARDDEGRQFHPRRSEANPSFEVDSAELIRRCQRWLLAANRAGGER